MFCVIKLLLILIAVCSACRSGSNQSINNNQDNEHNGTNMIVHLNGSLIPQTPNALKYKNPGPMKSIISEFIKRSEKKFPADRQHVKDMQALNGSANYAYKGPGDHGFFSTIYEAYNNHWAVRTVPDDWWYTIIRTVAIAIDKNSKKNNVRTFFVNHEGKKTLTVVVDRRNGIDYTMFFREMTNLIQSNIKINGYVETIRSDFSTSTATHRIVSEITVMSSMQEFFEYVMHTMCGIPYVELVGNKEDWVQLKMKFLSLKEMLKPIEMDIGLDDWWGRVEIILDKLIESFKGNADREWWSNIFRVTEESGFGSGGNEVEVIYDGWFLRDLMNIRYVGKLGNLPSGLVSVPLKFVLENGLEVKGAIVSGISGIKLDHSKDIPIVESTHGWAIFAERRIRI